MVDPEKDILENFYAIISARNYGSSGKCIHADEKNIEGVLACCITPLVKLDGSSPVLCINTKYIKHITC